jgi:hypothetical protein
VVDRGEEPPPGVTGGRLYHAVAPAESSLRCILELVSRLDDVHPRGSPAASLATQVAASRVAVKQTAQRGKLGCVSDSPWAASNQWAASLPMTYLGRDQIGEMREIFRRDHHEPDAERRGQLHLLGHLGCV